MDITSINIQAISVDTSRMQAKNEGAAGTPGNRSIDTENSKELFANTAADGPRTQDTQISTSLSDPNYIKTQLEAIIVNFPPFFPVGSPQRFDLIQGIKGVQAEIEKSPLSPDMKTKLTGQKLSDSATDREISVALSALKGYKKENAQTSSPAHNRSSSGTIVNLKT
jgi:hypothetical protein